MWNVKSGEVEVQSVAFDAENRDTRPCLFQHFSGSYICSIGNTFITGHVYSSTGWDVHGTLPPNPRPCAAVIIANLSAASHTVQRETAIG